MNKIYLLTLIVCLIGCKSDPQSIYHLDGDLWDFDWGNTQNHLAILMEEPDKSLIYIIHAEEDGIQQTIDMSGFETVSNITWSQDDQAILILVPDEEGYSSVTLKMPIYNQQNIDTIGHLGAYHQTHILDANPDYLAVLASGEGHPDISVYQNGNYEETILDSDVYPGGIGILGWAGSDLLVESDMRLDYGLDRDSRETYARENGLINDETEDFSAILGPLEEFKVFNIDVKTGKASEMDIDPFAWEPVSFDQSYSVRAEKVEKEGANQTHFHLTKK